METVKDALRRLDTLKDNIYGINQGLRFFNYSKYNHLRKVLIDEKERLVKEHDDLENKINRIKF